MKETLLNAKQTAELLGIRQQTLAIWRMTGRNLPYVKIGRSVRYKLSAVEEFIEKRTVPATA